MPSTSWHIFNDPRLPPYYHIGGRWRRLPKKKYAPTACNALFKNKTAHVQNCCRSFYPRDRPRSTPLAHRRILHNRNYANFSSVTLWFEQIKETSKTGTRKFDVKSSSNYSEFAFRRRGNFSPPLRSTFRHRIELCMFNWLGKSNCALSGQVSKRHRVRSSGNPEVGRSFSDLCPFVFGEGKNNSSTILCEFCITKIKNKIIRTCPSRRRLLHNKNTN